MLDITNNKSELTNYGGSELKKTYYIDNHKYMVKFPDIVEDKNKFYINNQYSEYIGCQVFKLLGIDVQDTLLVSCIRDNKKKIAVACKDFLKKDEVLIEMQKLSYTLSSLKKYSTDIVDVYEMIDMLNIDKKDTEGKFWDIFVVDCLLGNKDRHLGNIGFIFDGNSLKLAPVYDCGSCLNPLLTEENMKKLLDNEIDFKNEAYNVKSVYKYKGKSMFYHEYFSNPNNELRDAIKRIVPKIDLDKINEIIDNIETLSDICKEYYKKAIKIRYDLILLPAWKEISYEN